MEKLILLCLGLVTLGACDEDPIQLIATRDPQNLTTPNLVGITRPKDFRWRILLNNTEDGDYGISVQVNYLNMTESVNCTGSYLEIITDNYTQGRKCGDMKDDYITTYGSQIDIVFHVGPGTETPEFNMTYTRDELIICYYPYYPRKKFLFWLVIAAPVLLLVMATICACCCLKKRFRKQRSDKEKEANAFKIEKPSIPVAFTGPPSYEDVTKSNPQPPPYSSVALA